MTALFNTVDKEIESRIQSLSNTLGLQHDQCLLLLRKYNWNSQHIINLYEKNGTFAILHNKQSSKPLLKKRNNEHLNANIAYLCVQ